MIYKNYQFNNRNLYSLPAILGQLSHNYHWRKLCTMKHGTRKGNGQSSNFHLDWLLSDDGTLKTLLFYIQKISGGDKWIEDGNYQE